MHMNKLLILIGFALASGCATPVEEPAPSASTAKDHVQLTSPQVVMQKQEDFGAAAARLREQYPNDEAGNAAYARALAELKEKMLGGL
jgi:hypothetical protein